MNYLSLRERRILLRNILYVLCFVFSPGLSAETPNALSFDEALTLALQQAPALRADAARLEAATQTAGPASALPDPTLIFGVDNVPINGSERFSLDSERMSMKRIGINQQIPNRAKRDARKLAAMSEMSLADAQSQLTKLMIKRNTAEAWIEAQTASEQLQKIALLESENALLNQSVKARIAGGKLRASDVIAPRMEAAKIDARRDVLLARQKKAQAMLARWIGVDATRPISGAVPTWNIPSDTEQHLSHHPELKIVEKQVDVLNAQVREAEANKRPDWGVTLAYLDRGDDYSDMATLQFNMDLPLFSGSRQGPRIAAVRAKRMALEADRDALWREHEAMLKADIAEYEQLQQSLVRQKRVVLPLAEEKVEFLLAAWRGNTATLEELISARSLSISAQMEAIEINGLLNQQAIKIHYTYFYDEEPFAPDIKKSEEGAMK